MKYLTRKQATEYLRENGIIVGDGFLAHEAVTGEGPQFRYSGRHPLYTEPDLDAWIESRLSQPITSRSELRQSQPSAIVTALNDGLIEPPRGPPTRTARRHRWRKKPAPESLSEERA
jgi:hypothetical protein